MMTLIEINRIGYRALVDALGFDGAIRFLRQFDFGEGDYTKERQQWLDKLSLEDIVTEISRRRASETQTSVEEESGGHRVAIAGNDNCSVPVLA